MARARVLFALKASTAYLTQQITVVLFAAQDISVQVELNMLLSSPVILEPIILMKVVHLKIAVFLVFLVSIALAMV